MIFLKKVYSFRVVKRRYKATLPNADTGTKTFCKQRIFCKNVGRNV